MNIKAIEAYQLHDTETKEILGTVFIVESGKYATNDILNGWTQFNCKNDGSKDITDFVVWFNQNYETKLGTVNLDYVQPLLAQKEYYKNLAINK